MEPYVWHKGDCEYCGTTPEDWEGWYDEKLVLTDFHGTALCPNCIAEEQEMAERDAEQGIVTFWFDETEDFE